jgi:hypothetical protein
MSNVEILTSFVDGSVMYHHNKGETCRKAVQSMSGNDHAVQQRCFNVIVHTKSGKMVDVVIPFDARAIAKVFIDGEIL